MNHLVKIIFLLALLLPVTSAAYDFEVDGIYYKIVGTNASVTYRGTTPTYNTYSGDVTIPSEVTYNGTTYPVTAIGRQAFWGSLSITSVTIPNSVTSIAEYAFGETCLTSVTIPASVTSIGGNVFLLSNKLNSISVESGNSRYDSRDNCNAIIETATNSLVFGCMSSIIPNTVTSIGGGAFYSCSGLTTIDIPNSVTNIRSNAFRSCTNLTSVTIPNSVTTIGSQSFQDCTGLTSVTIPNSVTQIDALAFHGCIGLTKVNILDIAAWCNISFNTSQTSNPLFYAHHLFLNGVEIKDLVITNTVTSIGKFAFCGCSDLTSVTIPNSVTSIGTEAFSGCAGLTSVTIECENIYGSGSGSFSNCHAIEDVIVRQASPPNVANDFFDESTYQSAKLHVPTGQTVFFRDHNVWNKFTNIVEEDMPDVEIDSSPFNNLNSRRLILSYTSREDDGSSMGDFLDDDVMQVVKFPIERMMRIKGNEITHIRFKLWYRYEHVSNMKVFIGSAKDKRDLVCQPVTNLHEGWNEVALNEPYLITGDSIFVGVEYHIGTEDYLYPLMWDPNAGREEGACLLFHGGKWYSRSGTWYIQCMVEGDQVPKYDVHFVEIIEPRYNKAVKAGEPFEFRIELRNWGSMPIDHYEIQAQLDGTDIDLPQSSKTIMRGGGLQEIYLRVIPEEGTPPGCYQLSVAPRSLNGVEFTSEEAPLVTALKVYEHDMGRQKILVQVYSGSWCGYCPGFDSLLEQKRQERDDLAVVDIHSRDPFFTSPASESYLSMLYTDGIPNVDLNRCVWKTPYNFREYVLNKSLDDAKNQPAFATVNITGSFNEENHVLDLTVSGERNEDFLPVECWTNLTVLLVEDDIISGQTGYEGPYHHPAVLRTAISDIWGDPVQWNGDKYEMHYSISMDDLTNCNGQWNIENMRVVAFLGKPFTGNNYDEIGVVNCNEYKIINEYVGDVNGDDVVNISDVNAVIDMILSGSSNAAGDTNRDGVVNISDLNVIIQEILKS